METQQMLQSFSLHPFCAICVKKRKKNMDIFSPGNADLLIGIFPDVPAKMLIGRLAFPG
jgi:hypothetical protein